MRRSRKIALGVLALVALAGAGLVRQRRSQAPAAKTVRAERGTIERIVVASGTVEPEHLVEVRSKVSGIVERFHVDAGERVKTGQVVAEIDRQTLEAAVREARAVLREADVHRDHLARDLERKSALFHRGIESNDEIDRVRSEYAGSEARQERARATVQRLEQELAWATIAAPIDGLVLQRELNPGAAVASVASVTGGTVLMTIADTSEMHLLGVIDENDIAAVRVGMDARLQTDAFPGRVFPGKVRKIASLGDRKDNVTSFKVEVTVLEGVEDLRARLSADADIVADVHEKALVLPETALIYDGDEVAVDVVSPEVEGGKQRRVVKVGVTQKDRVEILDGLQEGDAVELQ
jgi:HlyD family secretion protein